MGNRTAEGDGRRRASRTAVLLLAAGLATGCAGGLDAEAPSSRLVTDMPLRADARSVLIPGETCTYGVSWGGVLPVGRVEYSYDEIETEEGKLLVFSGVTEPLLRIKAFLRAAGTIRTLADPETFLPVSTFWVTADDDPHTRTIWFDQKAGVAFAGKWTRKFVQAAEIRGKNMLDPIGAIFYGRVVLIDPESEIRVLMVEGARVHLMTIRHAGEEHIMFKGERVPCTKVSLRTDRLRDDGTLIDEKPWNDLVAWVAEIPGRPIMRISGKLKSGSVALKLAARTLPETTR